MRAVPTPLTAVALAAAVAACTSQPTIDSPRPLDAPVHSAARLFDLFLGPSAIARDTHQLTARAGAMLADEVEVRPALTTGGSVLQGEVHRIAKVPAGAGSLAGDEVARLHALVHSPAWSELDPAERLAALRDELAGLQTTLQLDRRAMGEPDDFRHRTDPDDDHPEAGILPRLLRRIFP